MRSQQVRTERHAVAWLRGMAMRERRETGESAGQREERRSGGAVGYSLCMHIPSVQFLDWSTMPSQSFPPFLGVGALHSLLLQWVHSVPQVDHLLHSVHRPSTGTQQTRTGEGGGGGEGG